MLASAGMSLRFLRRDHADEPSQYRSPVSGFPSLTTTARMHEETCCCILWGSEGRSMTEGTTSPDAAPETLHSQQRQSINRDFRTGMLITSVLTIGALGIEQSSRG